jgi:hypothetical protein
MNISNKWKDSLVNKNFADSQKDVELVWIQIDKQTRKTKVPDPITSFIRPNVMIQP